MNAPLTLTQLCLAGVVMIPLLTSAVSVLLGSRARRVLGVVTAAAVLGLGVPLVAQVTAGQTVELALGGFTAPLGITLRADGLSALFLAMTAVVGAVVTCYAAARPDSTGLRLVGKDTWRAGQTGFWPLWLGCWAGLNAIFVSADLFNTYVGLELVGLSAVALVALGGRESWSSALRYLFITVLGSLLFLVGVALIYSVTGTLDLFDAGAAIAELARAADATGRTGGTGGTAGAGGIGGADPSAGDPAGTGPADLSPVVLAMILMSLGLALKMALVPLHRWLIPAHSGAPSAVSPLLSGLVIKASLFVLLRCWLWVAGPLPELTVLAWLLAGMGAAAILIGSVLALRQTHLKPLVAYSTVAQVGYWFLLLPLILDPSASAMEARPGTTLEDGSVLAGALSGTVTLALGHGLAKASLFLSAGHLKDLYGTDEIAVLRGAGREHPMLILSMGLSAVGLIGLPLSLGFSGKWLLATSAVASGHYWMLPVLVIGTLLSAAYLVKAVAPLLVMSEDDDSAVSLPEAQTTAGSPALTGRAQLAPFVLGSLTVLTGFLGVWFTGVLEVGAPW
ncbi:complex I subunit 5 family protein [Nesterenkonia lutea]|uniref:Formate hydrogenlyase subunit 3/multisubunit Na+/H+ antiporter MnhD subunit n=1 Tax=Nesterenkonia lutea TaxID=272919 RepID=A0ABR9JGU2_9MICC|nr:proton-conducting transporter membrane subunit [Nesterenkonia lutea]MBE1525158.1 formate hydrogenlyase subunit 3/multisubunit Na+/H+ antiporter MnhD subunit [Nesterenkonia lutea]